MACPVRLRAIVVSPAPLVTKALQELVPQDYEERRLAQGAVATTGETTQGLDKLQDLEGKFSAFGVFGKLSIRVPGIFRLRFELYETLRQVFFFAHTYIPLVSTCQADRTESMYKFS